MFKFYDAQQQTDSRSTQLLTFLPAPYKGLMVAFSTVLIVTSLGSLPHSFRQSMRGHLNLLILQFEGADLVTFKAS